jgi:hypothetical protein
MDENMTKKNEAVVIAYQPGQIVRQFISGLFRVQSLEKIL